MTRTPRTPRTKNDLAKHPLCADVYFSFNQKWRFQRKGLGDAYDLWSPTIKGLCTLVAGVAKGGGHISFNASNWTGDTHTITWTPIKGGKDGAQRYAVVNTYGDDFIAEYEASDTEIIDNDDDDAVFHILRIWHPESADKGNDWAIAQSSAFIGTASWCDGKPNATDDPGHGIERCAYGVEGDLINKLFVSVGRILANIC